MKAAQVYAGSQGLYLASALGGTTDVDAVTLSSARLAKEGLEPLIATVSILIAIAVNTVVKTGLAIGVGGWLLGKRVVLVGVLVIVAGAVALGLTAGLG